MDWRVSEIETEDKPREDATCLETEGRLTEVSRMDSKETIKAIYEAYPRKVARPKAYKAIEKALKKVGFDVLIARVNLYREHAKTLERKYIPLPTTWFNQERWDDYEDWDALSKSTDCLSEAAAWLSVCEAAKKYHVCLDLEEIRQITDCVPEPARSIARRIGWGNVLNDKFYFTKLYREAVK